MIFMKTITIKVHEFQNKVMEAAAQVEHITKSELIRRSVTYYLAAHPSSPNKEKPKSIHDRLKKFIPKAKTGVPDLASNPKHMEGFGQ